MIIVKTPKELGKLARANRKAVGRSLRHTSAMCNIGVRFLSEFERGKSTAEIGKVIVALQVAGLDLAVIPQPGFLRSNKSGSGAIKEAPKNLTQVNKSDRLSQRLNLEFPYDWSNPDLDDSTFIQLVLAKTRFNDILRIAHYFGFDRIELESRSFVDTPQGNVIKKLLSRIQAGIKLAKNASTL